MPTEIIDEIIEYIRYDIYCLRSCALISKSWTPSCRRHIFATVAFDGPFDLMRWSNSISPAPDGPHIYTRNLTISNRHLEEGCYRLPDSLARFLQHLFLFCNVQNLVIECSATQKTIDKISVPDVFGHLLGTLRSLSIRGAFCSPEALLSLVASFQLLERLELEGVWFAAMGHRPPPERRTFKGVFRLADWGELSEGFVGLLAEHDLQYHEMLVTGEWWLRDTVWNKCLAKCADRLERFDIHWSESDCECVWCQSIFGLFSSASLSGTPDARFKPLNFRNLRSLTIHSPPDGVVHPPALFLSSITSTRLSEITFDVTVYPPGDELTEALSAIRGFDEALCQLAKQLDPSFSGSGKLVVTLGLVEEIPNPTTILPLFSKLGILKVVASGM